ncbi:MAG: CDP-glycerol glycerophosphotransferase family protein [Bryobacteraceae bacterium]
MPDPMLPRPPEALAAAGRRVLFVAGNIDTHLKSYLPVIAHLRDARGILSAVLLLEEPRGLESESTVLRKAREDGVEILRLPTTSRPAKVLGPLRSIRFALRYPRELRAFLRRTAPRLVVTGNDICYPAQCALRFAAELGIPSLVVEDAVREFVKVKRPFGLRARRLLVNVLARGNAIFGAKFHARWGPDVFAVWGEYAARYYLASGVARERVVATGQPRFDAVFTEPWAAPSAALYQRLRVDPEEKRIVFAPNWIMSAADAEEQVRGTEALLGAVRAVSAATGTRCRVIVKLPRVEDNISKYYDRLPSELLDGVITMSSDELYPLLAGCDLAVTFFSTVGFEAALFGKPLITINLSGLPDIVDYAREGIAVGVYSAEGFVDALSRCLFDAETRERLGRRRREYLELRCAASDRLASERVGDLVCSLLSSAGGDPSRAGPPRP